MSRLERACRAGRVAVLLRYPRLEDEEGALRGARLPVVVKKKHSNVQQGANMFEKSMTIEGFDDEIFAAIGEEERRQEAAPAPLELA